MVILLDSSIAAHRAQHKDVETDFFFFLSILRIPDPSELDGLCRSTDDALLCRKGGGRGY